METTILFSWQWVPRGPGGGARGDLEPTGSVWTSVSADVLCVPARTGESQRVHGTSIKRGRKTLQHWKPVSPSPLPQEFLEGGTAYGFAAFIPLSSCPLWNICSDFKESVLQVNCIRLHPLLWWRWQKNSSPCSWEHCWAPTGSVGSKISGFFCLCAVTTLLNQGCSLAPHFAGVQNQISRSI